MSVSVIARGVYRGRVKVKGKDYRRNFDSRAKAELFCELIKKKGYTDTEAWQFVNGYRSPIHDPTPMKITFKEFIERDWLEAIYSGEEGDLATTTKRHAKQFMKMVMPLLGGRYLHEIGRGDWGKLKRYLTEIRKKDGSPYSVATKNSVLKAIKRALWYAHNNGYIEKHPFLNNKPFPVKDKKEKEFWRQEQVEKFLTYMQDKDPQHYMFYLIALNTGMRRSEILGLRRSDIDLPSRIIHVRRQWDAGSYDSTGLVKFKDYLKNGSQYRVVPMSDTLFNAMRVYIRSVIGTETQLFYLPIGFMNNPTRTFKKYAKEAGVPPIVFHGTRDTAIGNLKVAGVSDWLIAQIVGCSIDNLKNYGHLNVADCLDAVKALNVRVGYAEGNCISGQGVKEATNATPQLLG